MTERYEIILADPPWSFDSTRGTGNRRSVERQYPVLSVEEVEALWRVFDPVTTPIARLFLWVPDSQLEAGLRVMRAWGYRPIKTAFVWVKLSPRQLSERGAQRAIARGEQIVYTPQYGYRRLVFGSGRTTRNGAELCLLGARGSMPVWSKAERQVIVAPQREHSRKPDEQYERIEAMYPRRRYLELFARARRKGWAAWGTETDRFSEAAS